jgi:hypothetical protein
MPSASASSHALFGYGMDLSDRLAELRILRDHSR